MRNLLLLLAFLMASSIPALAQADGIEAPKLQLQGITMSTTFFNKNNEFFTVQDFKALTPNSVLLDKDFSTYRSPYVYGSTSGQGFSVLAGFSLSRANERSEKFNQTLRLGIQGMDVTLMSLDLGKITRVPLDTLSSPSLPYDLYVDSIYSDNYWLSQRASVVALDASLIFTTKPDKRFKIFVGVGASLGAKFNAMTDVVRSQQKSVSHSTSPNTLSYYYSSNAPQEIETYRNKAGIYSALYVPIGYSFRMGNKREFWRRLHLTGEMRPQVTIIGVPEVATRVSSFVFAQGGFRYNLGDL